MLRIFTAFSGYDSQCLALDVIRRDSVRYVNDPRTPRCHFTCDFHYELVGWSEIDKYAIKAHNALFPQWADRNYGDISKIQAAGISKSQQCKMAGNSIVVNTLAAIFRQLFVANFNKVVQTEIF